MSSVQSYFSRNPFGQLDDATGAGGTLNPGTGFTGASTPNSTGGFTYLRNRWFDPQTGRFLTQDPIGLAGGMNLYSYAGNNPVAFADPFGLKADTNITYNSYGQEIAREGSDAENKYFLQHDGDVSRLDYRLTAGKTPYEIHTNPGAIDGVASALASMAPVYGNRLSIALHSLPRGTLDLKRNLLDRTLWNAGNGLYVHKHAVGNVAWGNYMALRGYELSESLRGGSMQGFTAGGEDPLDQQMIRRGYALPH